MDESEAVLPLLPKTAPDVATAMRAADAAPEIVFVPLPVTRWLAAIQVVLVSGIPTGIVISIALLMFGLSPFQGGVSGTGFSLEFFATLSLIDTALIALLIRIFLIFSGETSAMVFLGRRSIRGEVLRGLALVPIVFVGVIGIVVGLRSAAPWLHTVARSPLQDFMRTPMETAVFFVVVVVAGGIREELQRAFILHRFRQRLGGVKVGLAVFSITFAALHLDQGVDVALAIGLLGLLWGVLYIRRGSAVMSMVNHAGFNAAQVAQQVLARAVGL